MKKTIKYKLSNLRRTMWKEQRPRMEKIRQRAVIKAALVKQEKARQLKYLLSQQKQKLYHDELIAFIHTIRYNYKGLRKKDDSMIRRFKRYGFIEYDAGLGIWINNCYQTPNLTSND